MCDQGSIIKFCSCDTGNLDPPFPYWVLYREVGRSGLEVMGIFLAPKDPLRLDQITIQTIVTALNGGSSFDFDYEQQLNDVFVLNLSEYEKFVFKCQGNHGDSNGLSWNYDQCPLLWDDDFEQVDSGVLAVNK